MTEQEIKTNISCLAQKCILICGAGGLIGSTLAA